MIPDQVLDLMRSDARHCWTLEEIHEGLAGQGTSADQSSVFRAVGRLEETGALARVALDDRRARYEIAATHHDHLVCDSCGSVAELDCAVVGSVVAEVRRRAGFAVDAHRLVLSGTCSACQDGRP